MGLFWVFKTKWFYFPVISFNAFCPENFYGSEIQHGIFGGLNFGAGIFWQFCLNPKGFFWVLIFAPIRSSLSLGHLKFGVPPPPFPSPGSRSGSISFISCMNFYGSSWTKNGPKEYENVIILYLLLLAPPLYLQLLLPPFLALIISSLSMKPFPQFANYYM